MYLSIRNALFSYNDLWALEAAAPRPQVGHTQYKAACCPAGQSRPDLLLLLPVGGGTRAAFHGLAARLGPFRASQLPAPMFKHYLSKGSVINTMC